MYKIPKIYIQAQIWRKPITRLWHDMDASKGLLTVSPFQTFLLAFLERPQDEFLSFVFFQVKQHVCGVYLIRNTLVTEL